MILVVCMAGLNTRFHNAGFDIPKYLLPLGTSHIITEILKHLTSQIRFSKIILVANKRDVYFKPQLKEATRFFDASIMYVDDTAGQASTALLAIQTINSDEPILIHNGDTIVLNRNLDSVEGDFIQGFSDCYVDVFQGSNPAWCYVNADFDNKVTSIAEKKTITRFASSGLYGFKNAQFYIDTYYDTIIEHGEFYISTLIENIIKDGKVHKNPITSDQSTIVLGTPAEYFSYLSSLFSNSTE